MTYFGFLLASLLLSAPPAPQPAPSAALPVGTVAVYADEQLRATLTLANHTTLLFFCTLNSPNVRVVGLLPTGKVTWETPLRKAQVAKMAKVNLVDRYASELRSRRQ